MSEIRPTSYWMYLYIGSYLLLVLSIVLLMSPPWWVVLLTIIISIITLIIIKQQHIQPIHITQPDPENRMTNWQLLYEGYDKNELWEATLLDIRSYGNCIQLIFDMVHPIAAREYIVIWQDQVDIEAWRQLKVLSRWS